jgi:ribosome recycling factor
MDIDEIILTCEESMEKGVDYLKQELRGVRTGRATPALVEYVKVDYYGSATDLRQLALTTVPEPNQLLIKPYDVSSNQAIIKGIQASGLGLNPASEGKQIRLILPQLSGERRQQLVGQVKLMGEQAKVTVRNARREANRHVDQVLKDKTQHLSEDAADDAKEQVQELVKQYEKKLEDAVASKTKEIQEI